MKKTTLATIKSYIKNNLENLYIRVDADFDPYQDCVTNVGGGFHKIEKMKKTDCRYENTLGIKGAWFVGQSGDWFKEFENETFKGYSVSNCCGAFILATKK